MATSHVNGAICERGVAEVNESARRIKVLYVCHEAHWADHHHLMAERETCALLKAGIQVSLCTFRGIPDQEAPQVVPHRTVVSTWLGYPLDILTRLRYLTHTVRHVTKFIEQFSTLCLAVRLRRPLKYNVIYLRDGDPFIFMPFILGLFVKDHRWAISLIGTRALRSTSSWFYKFVNASLWKPVYRRSFSRNRYTFFCENIHMKNFFETDHLDGILSGRVRLLPRWVEKPANHILQRKARAKLGLPEDKAVFLHFGTLHLGKSVEPILAAIRDLPDALLVHAGYVGHQFNLRRLVERYGLESRVIAREHYIPEHEKQHYFSSADAIILSYKKDFVQTASMLWEAAKFKLPAIASESGELGELVQRYQIGLVFRAEDATSLKTVLSKFLNSTQKEREDMGSNYNKFSDDFSVDTWVHGLVDIITDLNRDEGG